MKYLSRDPLLISCDRFINTIAISDNFQKYVIAEYQKDLLFVCVRKKILLLDIWCRQNYQTLHRFVLFWLLYVWIVPKYRCLCHSDIIIVWIIAILLFTCLSNVHLQTNLLHKWKLYSAIRCDRWASRLAGASILKWRVSTLPTFK